ncbi:unnamed protein product [Symbiodinium pilosum]|uniref:Uncharacterized protein n=1 Tax=Symbiodinium pilosum TaxID=2952 RepID=A0A812SPC6_SYMPI|nr:unnamed protein product [Symbiodinium pilosum]
MAGTAGYPFEDSGDVPAWTETLYQARPWSDDPPLSRSPYDQAAPEMLYKLDLFHLFKVGIGRDVAGSTCLLCRLGYFDYEGSRRNLAHRLCNAHKSFKLWCLAMHKSPGLRYFSPAFFNMKRLSDYAWSNSKGSDTMLLLGWLHWFVSARLQQEPPLPQEHKRLFRLLRSTIHHGQQIFDIAYSHPLWLARECGQSLYLHLTIFLNGYQMLARQALDMHMSFFALKPNTMGSGTFAVPFRHHRLWSLTLPYIHVTSTKMLWGSCAALLWL